MQKSDEKAISIQTPDGQVLEGKLSLDNRAQTLVLCHPHPQYGGSMNNNVVLASRDAVLQCGIQTLRFNFRGVGQSTGQFQHGDGEAVDVAAACNWVTNQLSGAPTNVLAYSFGALACLKAVDNGLQVTTLTLLSPPLSFMDFTDLFLPVSDCLVISGDGDPYCAQGDLAQWLDSQDANGRHYKKVILQNTDHFYRNQESALQKTLRAFYRNQGPENQNHRTRAE